MTRDAMRIVSRRREQRPATVSCTLKRRRVSSLKLAREGRDRCSESESPPSCAGSTRARAPTCLRSSLDGSAQSCPHRDDGEGLGNDAERSDERGEICG